MTSVSPRSRTTAGDGCRVSKRANIRALTNVSLYAAVVFLVAFFKSSDNLAATYGIAVASTTQTVSTRASEPITTSVASGFHFHRQCVMKYISRVVSSFLEGGWFPLLAGGALFTVMTTWHKGRETVVDRMKSDNCLWRL